nr:hypothetical protein GCM10017745_76230 [Saccharothrix mutabilis subsp. capreolus]
MVVAAGTDRGTPVLTPEDEGMAVAGPRRVAEVAVAALVEAGALRFTPDGLVHAVRTSGAETSAQADVLAHAQRPGPLGALVEAVAARVRVEPFVERGVLVPPQRWRLLTPLYWVGNLAAIGVVVSAAFGALSGVVLPALVASLLVAGITAYLRGPFAGRARGLPGTMRHTALESVPPLTRVAWAGLQGGAALTKDRKPVGTAVGVPEAALASLAPPERGRVGGWWKRWVSASGGGPRST